MLKFLPSAVIIFVILCFACVLNAADDNVASNNGNSPKDSSDVVSPASSSKHSSRRIRPSAWSKEEKGHLNPNDDKNKEQDIQLLDEETSLWNMKKLFRYVSSLFYAVNQTSDDSMDKSIDDLKIMMQSLTNNDPLDKSENNGKAEKKNSANSDTLDKSLDDAKIHNRSDNRQLVENSKIKSQNSLDKDSMDKPENSMKTQMQNSTNTIRNKSEDDREMRNTANNNALNKSSNDGKVKNSSNNDFPNDKQSTGNSKSKTAKSTDKDSTDKLENNKKTETQNLESPDTLTKSANDGDIQNSATNNTLNKSSDNSKIQESSNRNSSDPTQLNESSKNNQQNSINKDYLNKSTQGTKIQNPSNSDIQFESISALKDKSKEDVTIIAFKDYEDCDTDKTKLDDCTTNNTPEEEVNEQADDNDDEEEDEYDAVENDMDEDANEEDEDDAAENDIDEDANEEEDEDDAAENDMDENANEDDYINDTNNAKYTNENGVQDDHVKENNYGDGGKLGTGNPSAQITIDKKAHNNSIILPKFIIQKIRDQQNHSESQSPTFDNNDNVTFDGTKSQKILNQGKPLPEFQLSSGEFIDDYINNPQRKTPERENKQPSNTGVLIPNENSAKSKIQIPVFTNNFEEDNRSLYAAPSVKESVKDRNIPFDQSQNNGDNLLFDNNARTSTSFSENRKDSNPNKGFPDATFPQNVKNAPSSADEPVFSAHEDENVNQFIPLNLFPSKQKSHSNDVQDTSGVLREDYNVFTKPAALDFQNINFPVKTPHNDIPATNIYKPEVIFPFQMSANKPIALENERYLNDQYDNYNFQDKIPPSLSNVKAQQFEENQPIILQQDIFPNSQYISKQGTPNTPDQTAYFTNYKPETPANIPNINRPIQNTEMFPKYFISDVLQSGPSFSEMYNQDSSPRDIGNSMDKIMSQDYSDAAKPQNQINNDNTLNLQSDNLPFQDNFPETQIQFPQSDIKKSLPQNERTNNARSYESKMSSEVIPAQDNSKTTEFPQTQNGTHNSKELPHHSFRNTENVQIKPKNNDLSPVISENMESKSPAKSSQPLIEERQKNRNFDESGGQEQRASNSDSDSNNNGRSDESSRRNNGVEYGEDESEETTTLFKETDSDNKKVEDDFLSEHNYDFDDSMNKDNDEDDYEDEDAEDDYTDEDAEDDYTDEDDEDDYTDEDDENDYADEDDENDYVDDNDEDHYADEDDYVYKNNYDDDETKADNRPQKSKTDQNNNIEDIIPKAAKSHNIKSDENSSQGSELINDDYMNNHLRKNSIKENWPMNPSDEMINDATMQITQNATSSDTNDAIEPTENFKTQSESISSNQGENFNTILEYIYKYSKNPLFKGIRDEKN